METNGTTQVKVLKELFEELFNCFPNFLSKSLTVALSRRLIVIHNVVSAGATEHISF